MYRIALVCSLAVSSNTLKQTLLKVLEERKLSCQIDCFQVEICEKIDENYDIVVLMPHVRYNFEKIKGIVSPVPVYLLEKELIANNQVEKIIDLIFDLVPYK